MKALWLLLFLPGLVFGQTCATTAVFTWTSPQAIPADIDGFSIRIDGVERWTGTDTSVVLGSIPNVLWTVGQTYTFDLRSYKGTQYSDPTTTVVLQTADYVLLNPAAAQQCVYIAAVPSQPDDPVITP